MQSPLIKENQINHDYQDFYNNIEAKNRFLQFDLDDQVEVTQQVASKLIQKKAWELLVTYGDSLPMESARSLHKFGDKIHDSDRDLTSCKHYALFLYLSRLIRPIWELKATSRPTKKVKKLQTNIDLILPLQPSLITLMEMIISNETNLCGSVNQNSCFIENRCLADQYVHLFELERDFSQSVEIAEKQSLKQLKVFLNRCIDVIEFIKIITQDFDQIQKQLNQDQMSQLAEIHFYELISNSRNQLVQEILRVAIKLPISQSIQMLEERTRIVENLCKSFFPDQDNKIFLAESYLIKSREEKNDREKRALIEKGVLMFGNNLGKVNLDNVIPAFIEAKMILGIVDICLKKVNMLDKGVDIDQIEQIYSIIEALMTAIHNSITNSKLQVEPLANPKYYSMFLHHMNMVQDVSQKLGLLMKIVALIKRSFSNQPILSHLFRCFIIRGQRVDYLCEQMTREDLLGNCVTFFETKVRDKQLSSHQFEEIERLLLKAREFNELARMIVLIVSDQVQLKSQTKDDESSKWLNFEMPMEKRRDKVSKVLKLMQDQFHSQENQTLASARRDDVQKRIQELQECLMTICYQLDALESANHKIKAIQQMPQTQIQDRNFESEEASLKEFVSELKKRMFGVKDLKSRFQQLKLYDRIIYLLLNTSVNQSQENQRQAKIKHNLVDWISDLNIFFGQDQTKQDPKTVDAKQLSPIEPDRNAKIFLQETISQTLDEQNTIHK